MSLWTIDALMDSYTKQIVFAQSAITTQDVNQQEAIEEVSNLDGEVGQVEICGSGRIFASLERDFCSLKLWHNEDLTLQQAADAEVDFRRFYLEGAPIVAYELPRHRHPIQRFRFLNMIGSHREV